MAHVNVTNWNGNGARPCDWCGKSLSYDDKYIHPECYKQETRFYTQLGYDGESDVTIPNGYSICIPAKKSG